MYETQGVANPNSPQALSCGLFVCDICFRRCGSMSHSCLSAVRRFKIKSKHRYSHEEYSNKNNNNRLITSFKFPNMFYLDKNKL